MNNDALLNPRQDKFLTRHFPAVVHAKALTYRKWQDRQAYLGGRYLLQKALEKLHLSIDLFKEMKYTEYGRPYLPLNVDFNLSHSGEFVLLAISDDCRIGIDIEEIKEVEIEDFRNQFTDFELSKINQAKNKYAELYRHWTIKEAVMKADGRGISLGLNNIRINKNAYINKTIWYIKEVKISSGYIAHIAANLAIPDDIKCDTVVIPEL